MKQRKRNHFFFDDLTPQKRKGEIEYLITIINAEFICDIKSRERYKNIVEGRMVFSKVMREKRYSFEYIGEQIGFDHATIMHYIDSLELFIKRDIVLKGKLDKCRDLFYEIYDPARDYGLADLQAEVIKMRKRINELATEKERLKKLLRKWAGI